MICKDFLIHNYIKTLHTTSRSHPSTHPSLLPGSYHSARLMCTVCPCLPRFLPKSRPSPVYKKLAAVIQGYRSRSRSGAGCMIQGSLGAMNGGEIAACVVCDSMFASKRKIARKCSTGLLR